MTKDSSRKSEIADRQKSHRQGLSLVKTGKIHLYSYSLPLPNISFINILNKVLLHLSGEKFPKTARLKLSVF
jgi:hypothetical protein